MTETATETAPEGEASRQVRERLDRLRRERGLKLRELSARLGDLGRPMSVSTLSKITNGGRRADVDDLVALAGALEVSPAELLGESWAAAGSGAGLPRPGVAPELEAMRAAYQALEPLGQAARERVARWLVEVLDLGPEADGA